MISPAITKPDNGRLEQLTHAYGREIFARLDGARVMPFSPAWWDQRLMEWSMGDEAVKVQLFRFIDVLPLLEGSEAVNRHLHEYFSEAADRLPPWLQMAVRHMPSNGWAGKILARTARWNAERLARRFIAGADAAEALGAIRALRERDLAFTVDLLGEATVTEPEADQYQAQYFGLVTGLSDAVNSWPQVEQIDFDETGPLPCTNVSIKLSSLFSQFDPIDPKGTCAAVLAKLRPILTLARNRGVFINVDMEQYAFKDVTLDIFKQVLLEPDFRDWPDVGIAMQAYLRDTAADLESLHDWAQRRGTHVWVRLVKGAYWDYETIVAAQQDWPLPVYRRKSETDANYEHLTRYLLERYRVLRPAFGSHNIRSLAYALAAADQLNLPPRSFEIQMLYGMADPLMDAVTAMGRRVRIYTPVGQLLPGMAYLVRRLLENTANESFLRASFTDHIPEDQLLMNPQTNHARDHGASSSALSSPHPGASHSTPLSPSFGGRGQGEGGNGASNETVIRNEPLIDFSREDARQAMRTALEFVAREIAASRTYPAIINNRTAEAGQTFDSVNPSRHRQVIGRCGRSTVRQAEEAIAAAAAAFAGWRDTEPKERAQYLFRMGEVIRRRRFELAAWQVYECAKQWREADADVAEAIDYCDYYAHEMIRMSKVRRRDIPGEDNNYFYDPRGVVIVIAPWNFPLAILLGMSVSAIVTGNTIVFKPAEQSTVNGAKLMEIFQEVGLPPGVANFLPGIGEEIGPTLIESPSVAMIAFTGSRAVGLHINYEAARPLGRQDHVKRVISEMGGKNAIIVDDDADLDEAVRGVAASAFGYQGQKCSACSRAIVLDSIYDQFLNRLVDATRSMPLGPAEDPGAAIAAVIDADAQRRINEFIEIGKKECHLAYAGDLGKLADEGYYVAPHIFADVAPTAKIAQEEIFGPVLAVLRAKNLDEALAIANGTAYALTGGLYSRSPDHIARIRREFRVGNLYINRKITGALVDRQPFGGFKLSGIGSKAGGPDYLLQFVQPRVITENTMRRGFAPAVEGAHG
jgi:RHH-type proline utilization regulon transcriptional repressor/proline dehydrogenase/delta 1-pyrroline-5-carboxylate dehydrogenase